MKKLLLITAFPPNNRTAGQNYTKNLIIDLEKNEYNVDIVYFSYEEHEAYSFESEKIKYLFKIKNNRYKKILNVSKFFFIFPFFTSRFSFKLLMYIYKNRKNYDLIYLDFSQVFIYGLFMPNIKKYLMAHDIIIQKYRRSTKNIFLNKWVEFSEKFILNQKNSKVICFSHKDLFLIKDYYNLEGNKVDFFIDKKINTENLDELEDYFCFYGAWGRQENLESLKWFEKNIPNRLDYKIKIIGGGIDINYKKKLENKGFEVLGFVENPYEVLSKSKGLIAPLFNGAGVKVKVIEALSCGTPVIGTEVTLEGIDIKSNLIKEVNTFEEIIIALKYLKEIKVEEKKELKRLFHKEYGKNCFVDLIEETKDDNSINSNLS